jgi:hypothetical protein
LILVKTVNSVIQQSAARERQDPSGAAGGEEKFEAPWRHEQQALHLVLSLERPAMAELLVSRR